MVNILVIALFTSLFAVEYLGEQLRLIPRYSLLLPELLSGIALLVVIARVVGGKQIALELRYAVFLALYFFTLLFGFLAQDVPAGAVISGLRNYAKFVPFFLLPIVYSFTPRQLRSQLGCLLAILAVQVPLAVYQRFVQFGDSLHTGDPVRGMSTSSSTLSLLMLSAITFVVAGYVRKRIRLGPMLIMVMLLFLPTTLNETKSTIVLLPLALLLPAVFMPRRDRSIAKLLPIAAIGAASVVGFSIGYNYFAQHSEYGKDIGTFLTEGHAKSYLYTGAADGRDVYIGRVDSMLIAVRTLRDDPFALVFGLGAGNASMSTISGFEGQYAGYFTAYAVDTTQVTTFLWEIGIVGVLVVLMLYALSFRDGLYLARKVDDWRSVLGQVWAVLTVIMMFALLYKDIFKINELVYLFWFYTGVVASKAWEARRGLHSPARLTPRQYSAAVPAWGDGGMESQGKAAL